MPAVEAAIERFHAADTQVLGVSIDSVHSHANWARDIGGVSFPLLADFQPKGAMAKAFGHYLADIGITDRSTVIIDKRGKVQFTASVGPGGKRDIEALLAECEKVQVEQGKASGAAAAAGVPAETKLYVKSSCGFSRRVLVALDNLKLGDAVAVVNLSDDAAASKELTELAGSDQAPCLILDGKAVQESDEIVRKLAGLAAPIL